MATTKAATLNIRIEPMVKTRAQRIFNQLGLTTSEAVNLFLKRVLIEKGIPFDVRIPNRTTRKAMKDSEAKRNLKQYKDVDDLFKNVLD